MITPWGNADQTRNIGEGIVSVSTPSHGGYYVPARLYNRMPAELRSNKYGGGTWFEEDCEWALVALAFPRLFEPRQIQAAISTINVESAPDACYHAAWTWLQNSPEGIALRAGQIPYRNRASA